MKINKILKGVIVGFLIRTLIFTLIFNVNIPHANAAEKTYDPELRWNAAKSDGGSYPFPNEPLKKIEIASGTSIVRSGEWWTEKVYIHANATVIVDAYDGTNNGTGTLIIHANEIEITGTIDGQGKGYSAGTRGTRGTGGSAGAGGVSSGQNGTAGVAGNPGAKGSNGGGPASIHGIPTGTAGTGGAGGSGGAGGWIQYIDQGYFTWPVYYGGSGGTGGGKGTNAAEIASGENAQMKNGGYNSFDYFGGINTEQEGNAENFVVFMGSGGAGGNGGGGSGGGGGGGGPAYHNYWYDFGGNGGAGVAGAYGGAGGAGGAVVKLFANTSLVVSGTINTKGSPGQGPTSPGTGNHGMGGSESTNRVAAHSHDGDGGYAGSSTANGNGGNGTGGTENRGCGGGGGSGIAGTGTSGGGGAGGGIVLFCDSSNGLSIPGNVDARGADGTSWPSASDGTVCRNGGSVKIFYAGSSPSIVGISAAKPDAMTDEKVFLFELEPNDAPAIPTLISPQDGATNISLDSSSSLSWSCSTPTGNDLEYDVLIGTSNPPTGGVTTSETSILLSSALTNPQYDQLYYWKIIARDTVNNNESESAIYSFTTIANPPVITCNPTNLVFSAVKNGSNPNNQLFTITNTGGEMLIWEAIDDADWLSMGDTDGSLAVSQSESVSVSINISGLEPNTYNGYITISAPDATTVQVPVTLTINDTNPMLSVNPDSLSVVVKSGTSANAVENFTITNNGGGNLDWTASGYDSWISLSSTGGTISSSSSSDIDLNIDATSLSPGTYFSIITINAGTYQKTVNVTLHANESLIINSFYPASGPVGIGIEFDGIKLSDNTKVRFGNIEAANIVWDENESDKLVAVVPMELEVNASYLITVSNPDGEEVSAGNFVVSASITAENLLNRPNPFSPARGTTIVYDLNSDSETRVIIYNSGGKQVWQETFSAGSNGGRLGQNEVFWNCNNNFGKRVPNGTYHYFIVIDGKVIGKGDMLAFK